MNSYLKIAEKVLSEVREPLSARQIMAVAYRLQLVPRDLYGKTQHKTLHARLSEDIAAKRSRSQFVRVAPGRFLLRTSMSDTRIPQADRQEYTAPIRSDQLKRFYALSVSRERGPDIIKASTSLAALAGEESAGYRRYDKIEDGAEFLPIHVLIVFRRAHEVFVRRKRAEPDALDLQQPSLAMVGFIKREDFTLFSSKDLGISEASIRTLNERLVLPSQAVDELKAANPHPYIHLTLGPAQEGEDVSAMAAIVVYSIPNTPTWNAVLQDARDFVWRETSFRINDVEQFDKWSQIIIEKGILDQPASLDVS